MPISEYGKYYIWLEAEKTDKIEPSFEIEESPECSGGKYLSHPEDSGSAWAKTTVDGKEIPCGIGLVESLSEYYPDVPWQRCVVHFYRNILC